MTYVYDFAEGDKDQKDLLGGKGANLAEMTNLGLPVPPGFTITPRRAAPTCEAGDLPDGLADEIDAAPRARSRRRWAAGSASPATRCWSRVRSGAEVLDARDDGDGPQRRPQRRVGARPGRAERRRAVRAGLLPPAAADVRRDRARHRRPSVFSDGARRGSRRTAAPTTDTRPRRRRPARAWSRPSRAIVASTPAATSRRTRASSSTCADARGLRLVEHRARRALPPPGADPRGPRHRGQRPGDGLRQPRRRLRLRRRLHPRPGDRRTRACTATTCRTPRARTSSPASATPCSLADMERDRQGVARRAARDHGHAREPLPRHVRHRVHRRARQALDAADPGRQAHRPRRRSGSPCTWPTRA